MCEPLSITLFNRYRYFITFIYLATKWLEIRLLISKLRALQALKNVKALIENQSNILIKIIRTNWGIEYENYDFRNFLLEREIAYEHSALYSYEQNG